MKLQSLLNNKKCYLIKNHFDVDINRNIQQDTEFVINFPMSEYRKLMKFYQYQMSSKYKNEGTCKIKLSTDKYVLLGNPIFKEVNYYNLNENTDHEIMEVIISGIVLNTEDFKPISLYRDNHYEKDILGGIYLTGLYSEKTIYKID